ASDRSSIDARLRGACRALQREAKAPCERVGGLAHALGGTAALECAVCVDPALRVQLRLLKRALAKADASGIGRCAPGLREARLVELRQGPVEARAGDLRVARAAYVAFACMPLGRGVLLGVKQGERHECKQDEDAGNRGDTALRGGMRSHASAAQAG